MKIPDYKIDSFRFGTISQLKDKKQYPKGSAFDSLNWLTRGDRIELRRGSRVLGTRNTGEGKITGLGVVRKRNGDEVAIRTRGRKIEAYDSAAASPDWAEAGVDTLPAAASGEDVAITAYEAGIAGSFAYLSSPNSSIYKIPAANPTSVVDQQSTSHRGYIKAKKGSLLLWNRKDANGNFDKTSLYRSYVDRDELSDFTAVTNEILGSGTGAQTTFSGTLAFKGGGAKRTCMYVTVTDGSETFQDDQSGNLVGSAGGTGTINYATGAYSVTFAVAPANASNNVLASYYWEDATSSGVVDFTKSTPRTAGQGFVIPQPDGDFQNLFDFADSYFCLHTLRTRRTVLSEDDATLESNKIYREKVGIPFWRAAVETGEGIPFLDDTDQNNPAVRILTFAEASTEVVPLERSTYLDLSDYGFAKAVMFDWGQYEILCCYAAEDGITENDTMFVRFKDLGSWDRLDYPASVLEILNGALIAGDPISDNVYELFSGLDDDGEVIDNHWISGEDDLDVEGLKRFTYLVIDGLIGPDQKAKVSLSFDLQPFVEVGGSDDAATGEHTFAIQGDGDYVDRSQQTYVGGPVVGSTEVGGGTDANIEAYHFRCPIRVASDRFEYLRIQLEAQEIGWLSVNAFIFQDIRYKGRRIATRYVNAGVPINQ